MIRDADRPLEPRLVGESVKQRRSNSPHLSLGVVARLGASSPRLAVEPSK